MRHKVLVVLPVSVIVLCAAALLGGGMAGGPYEIDPLDVNCGGTRSLGGAYVLTSSTGQGDGVGVIAGGAYKLSDGFWPATTRPIAVDAALDWSWVYQNTQKTTQWWHLCRLSVTVDDANGNETYTVAVTQNAASVGKVVITPGPTHMDWLIYGGDRNAPDPVGQVILDVEVTGNEIGGTGTTTTQLAVRLLGDIDGDGDMDAIDKAQMTKRMNSLPVLYPDRAFNLTGDLDPFGNPNIDANDKVVMIRLLNSLAIQ